MKKGLFAFLAFILASPLYAAFECTVNKTGRYEFREGSELSLQVDISSYDKANIAMLTVTDTVNDESFLVMIKPEDADLSNCKVSRGYGYLTYKWKDSDSIPAGLSGRIEFAFSPKDEYFIGMVSLTKEPDLGRYTSNVTFTRANNY